MTIHWKITKVPESVLQNKELLAEIIMSELGIDEEEYKIEKKIEGSPFPFKLKWFMSAKRYCIYDASMEIHKSSFDVLIRPLNIIYGPIIFPLALLIISGLDGLIMGVFIYFFILLFFGSWLMIELGIAKKSLKERIKTATNIL